MNERSNILEGLTTVGPPSVPLTGDSDCESWLFFFPQRLSKFKKNINTSRCSFGGGLHFITTFSLYLAANHSQKSGVSRVAIQSIERKRVLERTCRLSCLSVSLSVGLSVCTVGELWKNGWLIWMPFGVVSGVGRGMGVLHGGPVHIPKEKGGFGVFLPCWFEWRVWVFFLKTEMYLTCAWKVDSIYIRTIYQRHRCVFFFLKMYLLRDGSWHLR